MAESASGSSIQTESDVYGVAGENKGTVNQYFIYTKSKAEIHNEPLRLGSPYLGLEKFEADDKDKFFGRQRWIDDLWHHLQQKNVLLLMGASGSGKSSLIRAGLLPRLKDEWGSSQFINLTFVPDQDPFGSLFDCLPRRYKQATEKYLQVKESGFPEVNALIELVKIVKLDYQKCLIFIDQFEELFTLTRKPERDRFIDNLIHLVRRQDSSIKTVVTMRSDFYGSLSHYPDFETDEYARLLKDMKRAELQEAIKEPAARNGVTFETGLVDQIIEDFLGQAGSLPLLQYTLNLLWEKDKERDGLADRELNWQTYKDINGVTGALQQQANKIYYEILEESEREAAKQIFIEIIDVVNNKPVSKRSNCFKFRDCKTLERALNKLIANRLLVVGNEKTTVEVAHEELLQSWEVLQNLIKEKEEVFSLRSRLIADANQWQERKKSDPKKASDELWSGSKLERILELRADNIINELGEIVEHFINASVDRRDRLLIEKEEEIKKLDRALTEANLREQSAKLLNLLDSQPLDALGLAIQSIGLNLDKLPDNLIASVQTNLLQVAEKVYLQNILQGHTLDVTSVAFSPNGQLIASGSKDCTIRLWDIRGNPIGQPFSGHTDRVTSVAFSPNGQLIVSGSKDCTIRLWDIRGNPIGQPFIGHMNGVTSVAFSPDGQLVVSGSHDKTIRLWDIRGNPIKQPFIGHMNGVTSVAFSPNGRIIASCDGEEVTSTAFFDYTVRLWDIRGNSIGQPFLTHKRGITSVAFSPDGQLIVSGSADKTICLWNIQGYSVAKPIECHSDVVTDVAFSPDGQIIASVSRDYTIRLWDIQGNSIGQPLRGHKGHIRAISFSPEGRIVATGSNDGTICLWDIQRSPIEQLSWEHTDATSVTFSPDGQTIASGSNDCTVRLWDTHGNPVGNPLKGHTAGVTSVAFSPNGRIIASGSNDCTVRLWDTYGNPVGNPLKGHTAGVTSVAFSPNGRIIASGSNDCTVRLWDTYGNPVGNPLKGHTAGVTSVAFSPNGRIIASGSNDWTVHLWDIYGNPVGNPFREHRYRVTAVVFSPDGELIASCDGESNSTMIFRNTLRIWDVHTSTEKLSIEHERGINSIAFSPDGRNIVTGSEDKKVRIWDLQGNLIGEPLIGHWRRVISVAFSPNGQEIASVSTDGKVHLWSRSWQTSLAICCNRLRNYLIFKKHEEASIAKSACETCQKYFWNPRANELNKQGIAIIKIEKFQEAIKILSQAIEFNPSHIDAYYNRGIAYASLKDYHKAIKDLDCVIKSISTHAPARFNRGLCYSKLSNKQAALVDLHKAAELYRERGQKIQHEQILKYLEQL